MRYLTRAFIINFILLFQSVYAYSVDCLSFQSGLNIQNESMEYIDCNIDNEKQGIPIKLKYRVKGNNVIKVENYLIAEFDINPIVRTPGRPYWYSYTQYHPKRNLEISIGTDENMYYTRNEWKNIDYFYTFF